MVPSPALLAPPTEIKPPGSTRTSGEPPRRRKSRIDTEGYLRRRVKEDAEGSEAGLLPLRVVQQPVSKSSRDELFDGAGAGMGQRQRHEELGGQLADVRRGFPFFMVVTLTRRVDVTSIEAERYTLCFIAE